MSQFKIDYLDPFGVYVKTLKVWFRLEYNRVENSIGSLTVDLPFIYPTGFFKVDGRLLVYVKENPFSQEYLDGDTIYLIRLVTEKIDEQGKHYIHILAHDTIDIVDRRIVAYAAQTSYSKKENMTAEVMIKAIMRENFGSLATDTDRDITSHMTIEPDHSPAQTTIAMTKLFPWQLVLPLIQDICTESREMNNEYLCFDVVPSGGILEFRTYIGQRGSNRGSTSQKPLVFSYANQSLSYQSVSFDASEEKNYIYCGGQGNEENRVIKTASDTARIGLSPFNRIEDFYNATRYENADAVQSEANVQLSKMKATTKFNGHIVQRTNLIFGVDYHFGDVVLAKIEGRSIDVHLNGFSRLVEESGNVETRIFARGLEDSL